MDFNAILVQIRNGRPHEARAALEAARAAGNDSAALFGLLARACTAMGDADSAQAAIAAGLARDARFPPLWLERAMLARLRGNADDLVTSLREAHALMPTQHAIGLDLARALAATGAIEEANGVITRVCDQAPQMLAAWATRGELALRVGDARAAEESFARAQRLAPQDVTILRGLADAAALAGKTEGEIWARERVAALSPSDARAHAELGDALRRDDRPDAGRVHFATARRLAPDDLLLDWMHLHTLPIVVGNEDERRRLGREWDEGIATIVGRLERSTPSAELALHVMSSATNFYRHYLGEPLLDAQRQYGRALELLARAAFPDCDAVPAMRRATEKRRVMLVSSHFHSHTIWKLFRSWCEALHATCELVLVHLDSFEDAATAEARRFAAHFVPAQGDIRHTVALIRELAPDAVVHLDVAMHPHGQVLSSLRLAPLQCATWGHPITTGQTTIDLFLSSDLMEPHDGERHYTERLERLPGLGLAPVLSGQPSATAPSATRDLRYVFCAQSAQKLLPAHDELFAGLLRACPAHALVLVPHDKPHVRDALAARIRARLSDHGIDPARLVVAPAVTHADFLAIARDADVVVDSLGWSGGMTTMEILSVGTPVVTAPGDTMRSRHTAALLGAIGRDEWIARDSGALVEIAASLAEGSAAAARVEIARAARPAFAATPWAPRLLQVLGDTR